MATLHVRNVSDDLYSQLRQLAASENQSLSAEVVRLLANAVEERQRRAGQKKVLAGLRRRRFVPRADMPDSLALLREDRSR